jgi:glycosyl hydrolase family 98 putative carbohydrate binding module
LFPDSAHRQTEITFGLTTDTGTIGLAPSLVETTLREVNEQYTALFGKKTGNHCVRHLEHCLFFEENGIEWHLYLRECDDGLAFRYELPSSTPFKILKENTQIHCPTAAKVCTLPYTTWYEEARIIHTAGELPPGNYGLPTLIYSDAEQNYLISESDIDSGNCGAYLTWTEGYFTFTLADEQISVDSHFTSPWRVLIVGSLTSIVESTLVDDLARAHITKAAEPDPISYVLPGHAAWSWWSSQYSGAYLETQKSFVDFAYEQGWHHVLVDCGWDAAWVPELVAYASQRNVCIHLWSSWSDLDGPENINKLALWHSWGVCGVKIDFMESESRERYQWYESILSETARLGLMVNFHGSVIPRGWARTYPQVIGYEAIRGAEYYVFYKEPLTSVHNVCQVFTRNVVGSMDYTPVTFSAPNRTTSNAHELALSIAFECGITHFADSPDSYRFHPVAKELLKSLPDTWDETTLLGGTPDSYALIARRSDSKWFIACINGQNDSRVPLNLSKIIQTDHDLRSAESTLVRDSAPSKDQGKSSLVVESLSQIREDTFIDVPRDGGFIIVVDLERDSLHGIPPEASHPLIPTSVRPGLAQADYSGKVTLPCKPEEICRPAPGWKIIARSETEVSLQAPENGIPGDLFTMTFIQGDRLTDRRIRHTKVLLPHGSLTNLHETTFFACANSNGPVERDQSNGGGDPNDGSKLTINNVPYSYGLGVSDQSFVEIALSQDEFTFTCLVGIDDETPNTSAQIRISVDGKSVFQKTIESKELLDICLPNLRGEILRLETQQNSDREAHIDWVNPRLIRAAHTHHTTPQERN